MNQLTVLMKKGAKILLSEGPKSLLAQSVNSLGTRIRRRSQYAAYAQIDRIANSDITNSAKFSLIYQKRLWLKAMPHLNPEKTLSGHGSTQLSTEILRKSVEKFLVEMKAKKFFDAPCGDFNWMQHVNLPHDCEYLGGDIVSEIIADLQQKYRGIALDNHKKPASRQFINFDLTLDRFPPADIWLCKDCLQHLSNSDILLVLDNFRRSQVKIALISNHIGVTSNVDIATGQFRHVDLTRAPFNLPLPRRIIPDAPVDGEPRFIGVWCREDLS
jgi:hypothetical protein